MLRLDDRNVFVNEWLFMIYVVFDHHNVFRK